MSIQGVVTESKLRIIHNDSVKSYYESFGQPDFTELKRLRSGGHSFCNIFHSTGDTVIQEVYNNGIIDAIMIHSISNPLPSLDEFEMYKGITIIDFNCPIKYFWAIKLLNKLSSINSEEDKKISVRFTYNYLMGDPTEDEEDVELQTNDASSVQIQIAAVDELRILFEPEHYYYQSDETMKLGIKINILKILQEGCQNFPNIIKAVLQLPSAEANVMNSFEMFIKRFATLKDGIRWIDSCRNLVIFRCKPDTDSQSSWLITKSQDSADSDSQKKPEKVLEYTPAEDD